MMEIIKSNLKFNSNYELRETSIINTIIFHHSGVSVLQDIETIHNYHKNSRGYAGIGYHFYIRKDGKIYEGRPINWVGAHAYGNNKNSIGICFEGDFENEQMSQEQFKAGAELIKYLTINYYIKYFRRHCEVNKTNCPGKNFPLEDMINYVDNKNDIDINYEIGKIYTTQVDLNVRTKPDVNSRQKLYKELTQDGKKHAYNQTKAVLKKGTRVSCLGIYKVYNDTWIRIPSRVYCRNI